MDSEDPGAQDKDVLTSAAELIDSHQRLRARLKDAQRHQDDIIRRFPESPPSLGLRDLVPRSPSQASGSHSSDDDQMSQPKQSIRDDLPPVKKERAQRYWNYSAEEETIRNDYSQRYVDSGDWPQNFVLGAELAKRFEEYPKQQKLLGLKRQAVAATAHQPAFLPLSSLPDLTHCKFDAILLDPPYSATFGFEELSNLPVPALAADPSFVFLWVGSGSGEGLDRGRDLLAQWGYRRCEDIVWLKTNSQQNHGPGTDPSTTSLFTRTKEHCLIGIRGTVRRSTDNWFVHCNIDTDVMVWEGDPADPNRKPPEMYSLIENFCLGIRRLELFGKPSSLRPGWVTVGDSLAPHEPRGADSENSVKELSPELRPQPRLWEKTWWEGYVDAVQDAHGRRVVPLTPEIEMLRPKSPNRHNSTVSAPHPRGPSSAPRLNGVHNLPPNPLSATSSMRHLSAQTHTALPKFPGPPLAPVPQTGLYPPGAHIQAPLPRNPLLAHQQPFAPVHASLQASQRQLNASAQPFIPSGNSGAFFGAGMGVGMEMNTHHGMGSVIGHPDPSAFFGVQQPISLNPMEQQIVMQAQLMLASGIDPHMILQMMHGVGVPDPAGLLAMASGLGQNHAGMMTGMVDPMMAQMQMGMGMSGGGFPYSIDQQPQMMMGFADRQMHMQTASSVSTHQMAPQQQQNQTPHRNEAVLNATPMRPQGGSQPSLGR